MKLNGSFFYFKPKNRGEIVLKKVKKYR